MTIRTGWRHLRCALALSFVFSGRVAFGSPALEADNKALIRSAFEAWRAGAGGPFSLLAPNATWTIAGHSIAAGRYQSRDEFMTKVIEPFNARLDGPLVPTVPTLIAEGDTVIALFDAEATPLDGKRVLASRSPRATQVPPDVSLRHTKGVVS